MEELISALLIAVLISATGAGTARFLYRIPLTLHFSGEKSAEISAIRFSCRWGPLGMRISPGWQETKWEGMIGSKTVVSRPLASGAEDRQNEPVADEPRINSDNFRDLFPYLPMLHRCFDDCCQCIAIDALEGRITFGTGDPAATGQMYGYYQAVIPLIPGFCRITLVPDFTAPRLEGKAEGGLSVQTPLFLLIRTLRNILRIVIRKRYTPHG